MKKESFRTLKVDARLRYLADIRGVPKDTIAVVEQMAFTDDGDGDLVEGLCRVRVVDIPEGRKRMPFMEHLLTIFESDAEQFEQLIET